MFLLLLICEEYDQRSFVLLKLKPYCFIAREMAFKNRFETCKITKKGQTDLIDGQDKH